MTRELAQNTTPNSLSHVREGLDIRLRRGRAEGKGWVRGGEGEGGSRMGKLKGGGRRGRGRDRQRGEGGR